ncbi:aldo/keto reductase [Bacillus sp. NP157]|nr:aldo/keto reductase [Bacillus sp. NP157]
MPHAIDANHGFTLNNDVSMPALGFGVFRAEPAETVGAVRSAIEHGYRLIDTASVYNNEREVGEAVRYSGIARPDVFLTTKVWITDFGRDATRRAFDRSVQALGTDYVDLYLVHWPVPDNFGATIEAYQAAQAIMAEGRIRAIGVCNFRPLDLDLLVRETGHVPAVNQVELHPLFNQPDVRAANERLGIVTQAWSPIGGINRYGQKQTGGEATADPLSNRSVVALAEKYRKTPAQIVLRWQLEIGTSPIPKSVRASRIAENIDVFDFSLLFDEVEVISALDSGERGGPDPAVVSPETFPLTIAR